MVSLDPAEETRTATVPGRRRMPKQARSREMVQRVLAAAGELFAERGYAETTTNLIAERAGASVGSVYQFFASKDEILATLQQQWTDRLRAALDERIRQPLGSDVGEMIDHVLEVHASFNQDPPGLLGFLLTAPVASPATASVLEVTTQRVLEKAEELAPAMPAARRRVVAAMIVHISTGLYTVGRTEGATNATIRAEVRQALLAYIEGALGTSGRA